MSEYKCIKAYVVPIYDEDGFETEKRSNIKENTIWHTPEDKNYRFLGGEVRLESDKLGWIEISNDTFKECFKELC